MIALNYTNKEISQGAFESQYMGNLSYEKAFALQQDIARLALNQNSITVLGLQHPDVLTLGHRAQVNEEILTESHLPVVRSTRGGLATIHAEGQLVIYPIMNLKAYGLGIRDYICLLLKTTQQLLKKLQVASYIDYEQIGLYTKQGKIAFCGVQVKNGITQHGISINVRNDLSLFNHIRSCGLKNQKLDRLQNYQVSHTLEELFKMWSEIFKQQFKQFQCQQEQYQQEQYQQEQLLADNASCLTNSSTSDNATLS